MANPSDILAKVLSDFGTDHVVHRDRVQEFDKRYRAYRAMMELRSQASDWTNKQHPGYVWQSVETMVANLVDPNPKWRLRVHPQMADPDRLQQLRDGARANELLLQHQLTLDHWAEKQREFDLQGLIMGITAAKQYWCYREGVRRSRTTSSEPRVGPFGSIVPVEVPAIEMSHEVLRDDPSSEVLDVRHLIFQKGATSLARSDRITHRCFYSFDQLKRLECQVAGGKPHEGECTPGRYYHNVDDLKTDRGTSGEGYAREAERGKEVPHKDDIEVLEQWRREGDRLRVVSVGQQKVLLADRDSPFWLDHLDHPFPFVVCSGSPDLFSIHGISEVEMMAELQEMMWTLINQRLDNLQLINNAIILVADDLEDMDMDFAPGEQFLVPRPIKESIDIWSPDIQASQVSLQAEALLKGDLQNITGGMPFLSGTDTSGVDQQTATGVSIVTSLAQKRLAAKRQQFVWAKARIGEQWCALNQQYVDAPRLVPIIGKDGAEAFEEIHPELLKGSYIFETEIVDDSVIKQQRQAESQAKFNMAAQSAMVMAGTGSPLNMRAFMDDVLDAYDISDKERYYSASPQAPTGQPAPPPAQQAAPNGVTNPALAAGPQSPSNDNSMNPAAAMQQLLAMQGGPNNAPSQ